MIWSAHALLFEDRLRSVLPRELSGQLQTQQGSFRRRGVSGLIVVQDKLGGVTSSLSMSAWTCPDGCSWVL